VKLRFLALGGDTPARARMVACGRFVRAVGLVPILRTDRFELWAPPDTPVRLGRHRRSVLIGFAYDRSSGQALCEAPATTTRPESVVRDYWGSYVLFADRPKGHLVLRDPSGAIPVYHRRESSCHIYASDDGLLWAGSDIVPAPDLDFVRGWLSFPFLRSGRTGAIGVRELTAGRCHIADAAGIREDQVWSPAEHLAKRLIQRPEEAVERLRGELLRCIPRAVPQGQHCFLKISGGLDSALVAAALAAAGRQFTCINFATRGPEGNERAYARAVAADVGVDLIELAEEPITIDLEHPPVNRLRPPRHPLLQGLDRAYAVQWSALGAEAVVDGAGGDNIFAYLNTASPVLDAWACGGVSSVWRAINDLAVLHSETLWTTAWFAWRKTRRGTSTTWPANHDFLMPGAIAREADAHPWLELPPEVRPGAREHVRSIVGIPHFFSDPTPGMPAMLHPLLAQPIVELALRIPTHLWITDGRDRAVARAAFANLLPEAVRRRRGKGALGEMFRIQFRELQPALSAFLLKGRLVEAGIVDPDAIDAYLSNSSGWAGYQAIRLLEITAAEQWLRSFD
jgi:asparagine synthase (glutamine-hydrolysing)